MKTIPFIQYHLNNLLFNINFLGIHLGRDEQSNIIQIRFPYPRYTKFVKIQTVNLIKPQCQKQKPQEEDLKQRE